MPYNYGIKNRYVPTPLIRQAYGWTGARGHVSADVPSTRLDNPGMSAEQFRQQFAYEWIQSAGVENGYTNPPFASGAAGRLMPMAQTSTGVPARIQRGYIRRGEVEIGKAESQARLYFMYNPEMITRDYVSYLDQSALDPFNTVYQSGNLVAPPSILDFSFSLFFDRAEEAMDPEHPGVFVDYQFFDMVVRNVVPHDANMTGNTLPDNGVMMVNPREITVVFSQQISVQGRPLNARVSFIKFTHRMVPTRMQIDLTIRATYLGPLKAQGTYSAEEFQVANTVQIGGALEEKQYTFDDLANWFSPLSSTPQSNVPALEEALNNALTSSTQLRLAALQYAQDHTVYAKGGDKSPNVSKWNDDKRMNDMIDNHWDYVDCSSLVSRSYAAVGGAAGLGWTKYTNTKGMKLSAEHPDTSGYHGKVFLWKDMLKAHNDGDTANQPIKGDLLLRDGHVAFFLKIDGSTLVTFQAGSASSTPQVGETRQPTTTANFTWVLRPAPTGASTQVGNTPLLGPS